MIWKYERFRGDAAIYAFCPKCEFHHNPSRSVRDENDNWTQEVLYQYNYCPMCGEYLYDENAENGIEIIWGERDILELYDMEE